MDIQPPDWLADLAGRFIVFDGPDGSGKSTQCRRFAQLVEQAGVTVCQVREPGGTDIGEKIRQILLDPDNADMDLRCEMLLYMASRAQLVAQRIQPALQSGQLVLADRFISSTLAYQGSAGGLSTDDILAVGRVALQNCWPDLVVIFDITPAAAAKRLAAAPRRGGSHKAKDKPHQQPEPSLFSDRIETRDKDFHQAVRQGFLQQADSRPDRYLVIDACADEDSVFQDLLDKLKAKLSTLAASNQHESPGRGP